MHCEIQNPPNTAEPAQAVAKPEPAILMAKRTVAQKLHDMSGGGEDHIQIPEIQGDGGPDRTPQNPVHGTVPGSKFIRQL